MCELAPLCYFGTDTNYRQVGIRLLVVQSESFSGTCTIARVGLLKKLKELMMTLWWPWRHSVATLPTLECETTEQNHLYNSHHLDTTIKKNRLLKLLYRCLDLRLHAKG